MQKCSGRALARIPSNARASALVLPVVCLDCSKRQSKGGGFVSPRYVYRLVFEGV
jgi:hypothetical protein